MGEQKLPDQTVTSTVTRSLSTESGLPPNGLVGAVNWLWHSVMGVFAMGFLAWAVIVWNATDLVKRQQVEMEGMQEDISELKARIASHEALTGHPGSLLMHEKELTMINDMQQQIDRRFKAIDDNQQRIMNHLDDISSHMNISVRK